MIYRTQFSTYEVDEDQQQVRRLEGMRNPTPQQGPDGDWQHYHDIRPVFVLDDDYPSLLIVWDDTGRSTVTSMIAEIDQA